MGIIAHHALHNTQHYIFEDVPKYFRRPTNGRNPATTKNKATQKQ